MFFCCSGASLSTSSGNSTQKDLSPFDDDIITEEVVTEQRVPSPIQPPRSPRRSVDPIGSPLANSTRLNHTFVEEHSLDISFTSAKEEVEEQVQEAHPETTVPVPPVQSEELKPAPDQAHKLATVAAKRPIVNPFDSDESEHGGTLSGRDPFDKRSVPVQFPMEMTSSSSRHRFSSSEDSIVH